MSRFRRFVLCVLGGAALSLSATAQTPPPPPPSQADAAKALRELQAQLSKARNERLALESRLEKELADEIAARAKGLAMGGESGALQRLEALLDSAHARLLVQRDRIRMLRDATRQSTQSMLVVLVRADSMPAGEVAVVMMLDGVQARVASFNTQQAPGLAAGAAEELYRAEIVPVEHRVVVQFAGKGFNAGETITIPAAPRAVTYVEFVLRGGRLVPTTWTTGGGLF